MAKAANVVADLVDWLGGGDRGRGVIEAGHLAGVTSMTVYRWLKAGKITDANAVLALTKRREPRNLKARFALAESLARGA